MKRKPRYRDMKDPREQRIVELTNGIDVAQASAGKAPGALFRYRTVLVRLIAWERKLRMAERKVAFYAEKEKYYEKRLKANG